MILLVTRLVTNYKDVAVNVMKGLWWTKISHNNISCVYTVPSSILWLCDLFPVFLDRSWCCKAEFCRFEQKRTPKSHIGLYQPFQPTKTHEIWITFIYFLWLNFGYHFPTSFRAVIKVSICISANSIKKLPPKHRLGHLNMHICQFDQKMPPKAQVRSYHAFLTT